MRFVLEERTGRRPSGRDFVGQRIGTDDQHPRLGGQLSGQHMGGALCALVTTSSAVALRPMSHELPGNLPGPLRRGIVGDEKLATRHLVQRLGCALG